LLRLSNAPITLASDAHEPHLVGEAFEQAIALAREHGRDSVCVFDGRRRRQEPLG
jgi:histidinol phosphatase-like PHP family hydrolase